VVLTGGADGVVPATLEAGGPAAARRRLAQMVDAFGADHVRVEVWDHGHPLDAHRNDALAALARGAGVEVVATNDVRYATPGRRRLASALAAVRERRSLDDHEPWLPAGGTAHLRSGAEQARRFARFPGVVARAGELGRDLAFDLHLVAPQLPPFPCPDGPDGRPLDEMTYLRHLVERGGLERYGPRPPIGPAARAWAQIDHEMALIGTLGFPGYFLVVWEIVDFCRRQGIYCQGRGSAANSAVCYALRVTAADAVDLGLLFERFLSPERDGPPDIDLDIESGRREEVIQHVYDMHGRQHAAQVANVISYRGRSAVRDMARALGYAPGQQDAWAKQLDHWGGLRPGPEGTVQGPGGVAIEADMPPAVVELAAEVVGAPRHLGIHSGGMVMCDRPVVEVCPVEWARMADRSVLQWDKDDCAAIGLVKFDLLGLGMLSALHHAFDAVRAWSGEHLTMAELPQDPEVYAMLCRADSIGVFQVESRAQMATLPRLKPREFYDLVVEVALIRPGPIQGGSVHPYIRRRNGEEEATYPHPLCERALAKTKGIPLFQEQLMQLAIDVAGFTPTESDQLRQAMGSKRSQRRMEVLRRRFCDGAVARGVPADVAEELWEKLAAFADYGFPESHSVSFAYLVYASSWLKRFQPAAFCAGLLNAQPMGFYSRHSLVRDARRHGVPVRGPDVNASAGGATLEVDGVAPGHVPGGGPGVRPETWGVGGPAVRLGLREVRGVSTELADTIAAGRPYAGAEDLARRTGVSLAVLEALATAGALDCFGSSRRGALWTVGAVAQSGPDRLPGIVTGAAPPAPATHGPRGPGRRRPVGHRHQRRWPPHHLPAGRAGPAGGGGGHRPPDPPRPRPRAPAPGPGGRRGHPPAASGHRRGDHLREPGGRDRPGQRGRLPGVLDPLPPGGHGRPGPAGHRAPGAGRGGGERPGRAHRGPRHGRPGPQPGLPLSGARAHDRGRAADHGGDGEHRRRRRARPPALRPLRRRPRTGPHHLPGLRGGPLPGTGRRPPGLRSPCGASARGTRPGTRPRPRPRPRPGGRSRSLRAGRPVPRAGAPAPAGAGRALAHRPPGRRPDRPGAGGAGGGGRPVGPGPERRLGLLTPPSGASGSSRWARVVPILHPLPLPGVPVIPPRATRAGLALVLPLALLLGITGCGDDREGDAGTTTTTTEADRETTTEADSETTTTGEATTTLPDETTTTAAPPVTGPADLQALLIEPAQVGEGFALDSALGNGAFSGELCEDVTLEETWADQASQALTRGQGDEGELVTQAVLAFAQEAEAEAFVEALIDSNDTCLPDGEIQEVEAGDDGLLIVIESGEATSSAAVVRVGSTVTALTALYPTAKDNPLTPELLVAAGEALAG